MYTSPLSAVLLAALALPASAGELVLRALGQESLPPKWVLTHKQVSGVCPDILAAISRVEPRLRFSDDLQLRSVPFIEQSLGNGSADVACALIDTPLRRSIASPVGPPLYQIRQRVAAAAGETATVNNLDDLARLKPLVNTSRGAAYIGILRERGIAVDDSTGVNVVNLKKLLAGHGRFFYMNELTLAWLIHENHLQDRIKIMPAVLREDAAYFWVSKQAPAAATPLLAQALNRLQAEGELARIYTRWAGLSQRGVK